MARNLRRLMLWTAFCVAQGCVSTGDGNDPATDGAATVAGAPAPGTPARLATAPNGPVTGAVTGAIDWQSLFKRPPLPEERKELEKRVERWAETASATELVAKARTQLALGRVRDGETSLREALRLQPANIDAWIELAAVYARSREAGKLFEVLGEVNDTTSGMSEVNPAITLRYKFLLAQGYFMTGRVEDARNILSELISRNSDFTPAYVALADSFFRDGKDTVAEFVVKRAMDRGKEDPALENLLGAIAVTRKDAKSAMSHFNRAIEMSPTYCQALVNRANLLMRDNDFSAAEEDLNRAISIDPSNADALVARGIVLRRTGRADLARASFERVLETDPVNVPARFNLAVLNALDLNRPAVALRLFEEVLSMSQASPSMRASAERYVADLRSLQ